MRIIFTSADSTNNANHNNNNNNKKTTNIITVPSIMTTIQIKMIINPELKQLRAEGPGC